MRNHKLRAASCDIHDLIRAMVAAEVDHAHNSTVDHIIMVLSEMAQLIDALVVRVEGDKNEAS